MQQIPVFHLKDFSDVIEVQFSEEMMQKLKPFFPTTPYRPYRNIAKRLFTVWSHSGYKGKVGFHKPYIPARWVKEIVKYSGIPYEDLEKNIVSARSGYGGKEVYFPQRFPVKVTEDHAWLLGLFFSSGGIGNRKRGRTRYPFGRCLRLAVSDPIIEKLLEIGHRIGDVPHIYDPNIRVRTRKVKRTGIGNRRRKRAKFHAVTLEILVKFGLPKYSIAVKNQYGWDTHGKGRLYSLRNIGLKVPRWIWKNDRFMHAFLEGYINGQKTASWAYSKPYKNYRVIECHVQVRSAGMNKRQTLCFLGKITKYLRKLGVTGLIRPMSYPNSRLTYWRSFEIFRDESLCKLFDEFEILRPDLRARLFLMKHKNPLMIRILQNLDNLTTVVFGVLLEKPQTIEELSILLRLRRSQVEKAVQKLRLLEVIGKNEKITIKADVFKEKQLEQYRQETNKLKTEIRNGQALFFLQCERCGKFVSSKGNYQCDCGGELKPVERIEALSLLGRRYVALNRDFRRIAESDVTFVGTAVSP